MQRAAPGGLCIHLTHDLIGASSHQLSLIVQLLKLMWRETKQMFLLVSFLVSSPSPQMSFATCALVVEIFQQMMARSLNKWAPELKVSGVQDVRRQVPTKPAVSNNFASCPAFDNSAAGVPC